MQVEKKWVYLGVALFAALGVWYLVAGQLVGWNPWRTGSYGTSLYPDTLVVGPVISVSRVSLPFADSTGNEVNIPAYFGGVRYVDLRNSRYALGYVAASPSSFSLGTLSVNGHHIAIVGARNVPNGVDFYFVTDESTPHFGVIHARYFDLDWSQGVKSILFNAIAAGRYQILGQAPISFESVDPQDVVAAINQARELYSSAVSEGVNISNGYCLSNDYTGPDGTHMTLAVVTATGAGHCSAYNNGAWEVRLDVNGNFVGLYHRASGNTYVERCISSCQSMRNAGVHFENGGGCIYPNSSVFGGYVCAAIANGQGHCDAYYSGTPEIELDPYCHYTGVGIYGSDGSAVVDVSAYSHVLAVPGEDSGHVALIGYHEGGVGYSRVFVYPGGTTFVLGGSSVSFVPGGMWDGNTFCVAGMTGDTEGIVRCVNTSTGDVSTYSFALPAGRYFVVQPVDLSGDLGLVAIDLSDYTVARVYLLRKTPDTFEIAAQEQVPVHMNGDAHAVVPYGVTYLPDENAVVFAFRYDNPDDGFNFVRVVYSSADLNVNVAGPTSFPGGYVYPEQAVLQPVSDTQYVPFAFVDDYVYQQFHQQKNSKLIATSISVGPGVSFTLDQNTSKIVAWNDQNLYLDFNVCGQAVAGSSATELFAVSVWTTDYQTNWRAYVPVTFASDYACKTVDVVIHGNRPVYGTADSFPSDKNYHVYVYSTGEYDPTYWDAMPQGAVTYLSWRDLNRMSFAQAPSSSGGGSGSGGSTGGSTGGSGVVIPVAGSSPAPPEANAPIAPQPAAPVSSGRPTTSVVVAVAVLGVLIYLVLSRH